MQFNLFMPKTNWTPPEVLPDFSNASAIAIDCETCDPKLDTHGPGWPWKGGFIAGYAISLIFKNSSTTVKKDNYYLPIRHENGSNLDESLVTRYMRDLCETPTLKLFHNSMYDIGWMSTEDIEVTGPIFDTQSGAALIDENRRSYSLDNLGLAWLNQGKDEKLLNEAANAYGLGKKVKANLWRLPPEYVGPYGEGDVDRTTDLWLYECVHLRQDNLDAVMQLEMDLIPMLVEMRKRGVRVDEEQATQVRKKLVEDFQELLILMKKEYDVDLNVWEAKSLQKAWDKVGLDYGRTPTGLPSFTKEALAADPHPLSQAVLKGRQIDKTISTFMDGMIIGHAHNGRIHHELHPLKCDEGGAVSGRFSCSHPNLQQATGRDPVLTPLVRGMFLPEEDTVWGTFDYASQEPRLTIHYAYETRQQGAEETVQAYIDNPRLDYHQMVADMAGIDRKPAKAINLGLAYGMGQVKLCRELGLPTEWILDDRTGKQREIAGEEGRELLETYHDKVPFLKGLMRVTTSLAQERGWIRTIGNRLCRFEQWESPNKIGAPVASKEQAIKKWGTPTRRAFTHKALNRLIQGSAADQTKMAMREIWREGIVPMHQMHDELDISIAEPKTAKKVIDIMENCLELVVPVIVDAEFGTTWADAKTTLSDYSW